MKLTFKQIKEEMKKGEVILEDTEGLLRKVLIFTTNNATLVTEIVSEGSASNGSVGTWGESDIEYWTIKPKTKKYWLWAYEEYKHTPLYYTDKFYGEDFRDTRGVLSNTLANSNFKTKLLHTEVEI